MIIIIPKKGIPIGELNAEDEMAFVFAPIGETRILATGGMKQKLLDYFPNNF